MNLHSYFDSPFQLQLSFEKVIQDLEVLAGDNNRDGNNAQTLLQEISLHSELRSGIKDATQIEENQDLIRRLLSDYFPLPLTLNEIKAINIPYTNIFFNHTERFKNILKNAGPNFDTTIRDFDEHQFYVLSCCIILNEYYYTNFNFGKPIFYDIPASNGTIKHYRILYNADF